MKLKIIALTLSVSVCTSVFAQNAPTSSSQAIETISISGARTPIAKAFVAGAISVIDTPQIEASGALSLTDLLRTVPSVNISQSGPTGTLSEIRFRGSESNHILVMLDGVEINDLGQGGLIDLSHLMLANISRIEILRGPQSALWGSSAVAGIINITSKEPEQHGAGNIGLSYGNKQSSKVQASYGNRLDKWRYSISASHFDTRGENIARTGNEVDGYKNTTGYAKLGYEFSAYNSFSANLRLVDYISDFDSTDFNTGFISDADNVSNGEQMSVGLNWDYSFQDSIWSQRLSYQYSEQENQNFSNQVFSGSTKGEKQRLVYNHNFAFTRSHINIGVEAVDERFEQAGPIGFGDPNQRQTNSSVSFIADAQKSFTKHFSVAASYRYDNNDEFNNADSYRVGANYQIFDSLRAFISYAKAVKNPTFTERFGFFPGTFLGNANLKPESSDSFELGIDASWQDYQMQLSWYRAELENEILGFVFDTETGLFTAQNGASNSQREGVEVEFSKAIKNWQWAVSYGYLDASEADAPELRRARHSGSAWIAHNINQQHKIYVQADYTGSRNDRFFPPFPSPSQIVSLDNYWLFSVNYRYQYNSNVQLSLRLSNAFNRSFEDVVGFSGESRRALLSIAYAW
ncbi:TonB-dependent receptor plug domain-containing protein [Glaciecola sp. SC05]|uniref:TonB-dependent receptor plug domain-containing protein n=1 Tax=Glaciecola sp. SC05 TaxID=1987355 RepID=UPI00352825BD